MKKLLVGLGLCAFVLSGCAKDQGYDEENRAGKALSHNEDAGITQKRSRGHSMSDQNPNLLNTDGGRSNHESYVDKAREVVGSTDEFELDSVWLNGQRLWVTVYKKGRLTSQERVDAEARLHKKLTKAIPRYDIEVKVQEDRS